MPPNERSSRRAGTGSSARAALVALVVGLLTALATMPAATAAPGPVPGPAAAGWRVVDLGSGRYAVSWTSPTRLPVTSDRPTVVGPARFPVGAPTVAADGRTVTAVVTSTRAPRAADLAVMLSGRRLDAASASPRVAPRPSGAADDPVPAVRRELSTDPATPGPYAVVSSDYTRTPVQVADMAEPIEMVGHVVEPAPGAATGPRPLVLFLHGRHDYCYGGSEDADTPWPCRGRAKEVPSQLGYDYVQRLLASQGFTTVSIRVNGINAQDGGLADGGAGARATIVAAHLDHWASIAAAHQVDLGRVVLVGHSRGGEGVDRAAIRIPLSAPYRVVGQVLIAPTDFAAQTAAYVPTVTLLPYCDGDVSDLEGQRFTDAGRDLAGGDTSLKSSVLVMGANHNFFNTEWTPGLSKAPSVDDWYGDPKALCGTKTAARLSAAEQRSVADAYIAGAVHQFTGADGPDGAVGATQPYLPLFDGSAATVASIGGATVYSHAVGGGRDLRRPQDDTALTLPSGARSKFCTGSTSYEYAAGLCGSEIPFDSPHWPPAEENIPARAFWQLGWTAQGQTAGLRLEQPLDLSRDALDLRTIVDPRRGDVDVQVRLTDAAGRSATLDPVGGQRVRALPRDGDFSHLWAQDVRVDARSAAGDLDLTRVRDVTIVGDSKDGRLWVADLAAAPDRVPPVAARRLPALSVGTRRVTEGDKQGTVVTSVPFTLSAPMPTSGRFSVVTSGDQEGSRQQLTIDLAAGQQSGTIPVAYEADDLDDPDTSEISVVTWGLRNVSTDAYVGSLVVRDDDPTPKVGVATVDATVREGASARWKVSLARPVDYDVEVAGVVVRGPGRDLTAGDVSKKWLSEHAFGSTTSGTLAAMEVEVDAVIPAGETSAVLSIPVRKDKKKEGKEAVSLRVEALGTTRTRTVVVAASS